MSRSPNDPRSSSSGRPQSSNRSDSTSPRRPVSQLTLHGSEIQRLPPLSFLGQTQPPTPSGGTSPRSRKSLNNPISSSSGRPLSPNRSDGTSLRRLPSHGSEIQRLPARIEPPLSFLGQTQSPTLSGSTSPRSRRSPKDPLRSSTSRSQSPTFFGSTSQRTSTQSGGSSTKKPGSHSSLHGSKIRRMPGQIDNRPYVPQMPPVNRRTGTQPISNSKSSAIPPVNQTTQQPIRRQGSTSVAVRPSIGSSQQRGKGLIARDRGMIQSGGRIGRRGVLQARNDFRRLRGHQARRGLYEGTVFTFIEWIFRIINWIFWYGMRTDPVWFFGVGPILFAFFYMTLVFTAIFIAIYYGIPWLIHYGISTILWWISFVFR